jgi:transcriptional regulator with XRE-family HTH domain
VPCRVLELLAKHLRMYRMREGVSQEEAAHRIGCSIPTYRRLEQPRPRSIRHADPRLSTLMSVLSTLGIEQRVIDALSDVDKQIPQVDCSKTPHDAHPQSARILS